MLFFLMVVIVFALLLYVVLDGYDLGIGVLTLFQPDAARRRQMLEVVGNVWDGNESWLILLAMGLWAVMPDAFGTALPGLYLLGRWTPRFQYVAVLAPVLSIAALALWWVTAAGMGGAAWDADRFAWTTSPEPA